jgi:hypothetical protein
LLPLKPLEAIATAESLSFVFCSVLAARVLTTLRVEVRRYILVMMMVMQKENWMLAITLVVKKELIEREFVSVFVISMLL